MTPRSRFLGHVHGTPQLARALGGPRRAESAAVGAAPHRAPPVDAYKIIGASVLAVAAVVFTVRVATVLLVLFAGVLLALVLGKLAARFSSWTRLPYGISVACVVVLWLGGTAAIGFFLGPEIVRQISLLLTELPRAANEALARLRKVPLAPHVPATTAASRLLPPSGVLSAAASVMGGSFEVLASLVVVFFVGVYGAAQPRLYVDMLLAVTPRAHRPRMERVVRAAGSSLARWLLGRLVAMTFVGVTTAIAFTLLHVPLALTLALLAGLLTFIAYLGAVLSAIPPVLLALTVSPQTAAWVLLLFTVIHIVEGYLLTPLIARVAVDFPPLLTLAGQVVFGSVLGVLGLTLSTPLLVVAMVSAKTWRREEAATARARYAS